MSEEKEFLVETTKLNQQLTEENRELKRICGSIHAYLSGRRAAELATDREIEIHQRLTEMGAGPEWLVGG